MSRVRFATMIVVACAIFWLDFGADAKRDNLPRLPAAVLLTGHLPHLVLTTSNETLDLRETKDDSMSDPTMSQDGGIVVFLRGKQSHNARITVIVTYSVLEKKWKEYTQLEQGGSVAISPDKTRLALAKRETGDRRVHLYFVDLKTGAPTLFSELGERHPYTITWSPDGRRIAFDMDVNRSPANTVPMIPTLRPAIHVLDLGTRKISKIADGRRPAWSPSGEWIAYLNFSADKENAGLGSSLPNANQACVIHADGTGLKVLVALPGDKLFMEAPVWSPDSKAILLNKVHDELKTTMDIYLLDLATLKLTKKFKGTPPVYGWAEAK